MSKNNVKLLLIEDDAELARSIAETLADDSRSDFAITVAGWLADGLQRLAESDVDFVLLDLSLPDSDGLGTFRRLHAQRPEVPVIVLTALEDEEMALKALREGAQDYLLKSELNGPLLVRAIRYALERKRGEDARLRLAAIVESSRDAIIGLNLEGLIVSWNPGAAELFGYGADEVIGRPLAILAPPDLPDDTPALLDRLKRGELVHDFETVRRKKDGQIIHIAASLSLIKNTLGKVMGVSLIARDIEERVQAEKEREELLRQLQAAFAQLKTLSGLLPICASCKKIRDDQGYWKQVEVYVQEHSKAEFTHGICPECAAKYRAGIRRKRKPRRA